MASSDSFDPLGDMYGDDAPAPADPEVLERRIAEAVVPVAAANAEGEAERASREGEDRGVLVVSGDPTGYKPGQEVVIAGTPAAYNYTYGPILLYEGPNSIDEIYRAREPVVVFADMIPIDELQRIELTRVRGFVFEKGSPLDEEEYNFLWNEKRASVIGCTGALFFAERSRDKWVIVDGVLGLVCFCPTEQTLERFQKVRALGPPPRTREQELTAHFKHMLDAKLAEKERKEKAGEARSHPHDLTPKEALAVQNEGPGVVIQLLSGLPVPELLEWERKQKERGIEF